jgi:hypothetical protein
MHPIRCVAWIKEQRMQPGNELGQSANPPQYDEKQKSRY